MPRPSILDEEVVQKARWLDALKYPVIDELQNVSLGPPPVILTIGRLLSMRAVVTDVSIAWQPSFDPDTLMPHGADVSVTFAASNQRIGNYRFDGQWSSWSTFLNRAT